MENGPTAVGLLSRQFRGLGVGEDVGHSAPKGPPLGGGVVGRAAPQTLALLGMSFPARRQLREGTGVGADWGTWGWERGGGGKG